MMRGHYNLIFIGAGPATIGAVIELINNGYEDSIGIIERGKSLKTRLPNEVISGVAGAGAFSDSKMSSSPSNTCGGILHYINEEDYYKYEQRVLNYFNHFKSLTENNVPLTWDDQKDPPKPYLENKNNLSWDIHKTCHVGTDNGQAIYKEMEKFIKRQPGIDLITETEVLDVVEIDDGFKIILPDYYLTCDEVVVATGQKSNLSGQIINKFNLNTIPRAFQLGVRVEDIINDNYKEIIKSNYDFKFVKEYNYPNDVKVRVRTFCCNSGNAHTCAEINKEGFTCFNGHAYKQPDPSNNSVNYGIICEISGLDIFNTKEKQINLMKKINNLSTWREDNFNIKSEVKSKRKLLEGFEHLRGLYPDEVIKSLSDFVKELNKIVPLNNATYLYPEVKLNDGCMVVTNEKCETSKQGLYFIGDCNSTRGIIKAFIQGLQFADGIGV